MHPLEVRILPMTSAHLDAVAALERACFSTPWSRASLAGSLRSRVGVLFVAEEPSGDLVGYAGMNVVLGTGSVLNVAVAEHVRRRGVAVALVQALLDHARQAKLTELTLEVRPSNTPAVALYESFGFREVGRRPGYYQKPTEDALLLTCTLAAED